MAKPILTSLRIMMGFLSPGTVAMFLFPNLARSAEPTTPPMWLWFYLYRHARVRALTGAS
jgi:hypothetical protein